MHLPLDWFLLLLRIAFIGLLFVFLYQVARVTSRELATLAASDQRKLPPVGLTPDYRLEVVEPAIPDLPAGTQFPLQPVNIIGRRADCTIVLNENHVSGQHAELSLRQGQCWLQDLSSTNGTFVNGHRLTAATGVQSGDLLKFGRITLRLMS